MTSFRCMSSTISKFILLTTQWHPLFYLLSLLPWLLIVGSLPSGIKKQQLCCQCCPMGMILEAIASVPRLPCLSLSVLMNLLQHQPPVSPTVGGETGPSAAAAWVLQVCLSCSCFHLFLRGCFHTLVLGREPASSGMRGIRVIDIELSS